MAHPHKDTGNTAGRARSTGGNASKRTGRARSLKEKLNQGKPAARRGRGRGADKPSQAQFGRKRPTANVDPASKPNRVQRGRAAPKPAQAPRRRGRTNTVGGAGNQAKRPSARSTGANFRKPAGRTNQPVAGKPARRRQGTQG